MATTIIHGLSTSRFLAEGNVIYLPWCEPAAGSDENPEPTVTEAVATEPPPGLDALGRCCWYAGRTAALLDVLEARMKGAHTQ